MKGREEWKFKRPLTNRVGGAWFAEMGSQQPKSMLMRRSKKSKAEAEAQGLTQGSQVPLRAEVLTMVESAGGLGEASGSRGVQIHDDDTYDAAMNAPVAIKESSVVRVMKKVRLSFTCAWSLFLHVHWKVST